MMSRIFIIFLAARVALYLHMSLTHSLMIIHQSERASTSDQITSNFLVNNIQLPHGRHGHGGYGGHVDHGGRGEHGGHGGHIGQDRTGQNGHLNLNLTLTLTL